MKKALLTFMAILATEFTAIAQNSLSVADVTLPQNSETTLTVSFQFDVADSYTGYSFSLELPSDLEFVMDEGTDVAYIKGACHDATHSVTANLSEGKVKVAGLSLSSKPLSGTSGTLLQFTVRPTSQNLVIGQTYTGNITDVIIVPVEGTKQSLTASTFAVTIGTPTDLRTILDETSTTVPEAATGVDVRVKRTIKANEWSTICLPFAMTEAQVKAAFGNDVQLGNFCDTESTYDDDDNVVGLSISFNDVTEIEANHPYIIKVSQPITEFTVDGVDIDPAEDDALVEVDNGLTGRKRVVYGGFYGTYHAQTELEKFALFLNSNKFWYSVGLTKMKAFRAYFVLLDVLTEVETANARISMNFNEKELTGISTMHHSECLMHNEVYDLQGRRVSGAGANSSLFTHHSSLKKGLYIKNGRKEVVR